MEKSAHKIPLRKRISTLRIRYSPAIITSPKKISYHRILRLKKMGSRMDAKNDPVEKMARVMETLEMLMARKKKIQCKAIKIPPKTSFAIWRAGNLKFCLVASKYISTKRPASPILYHTICASLMLMSAPKMAVKPQMNTIKCRCK